MTRTVRTSLALALLAATAATPALAGPGGHCGGGPGGRGRMERLERGIGQLGLAPDVSQAAFAALDKARAEQRALFPDMKVAYDRLKTLLAQDKPSADAVTAQADVIGVLKTQMERSKLQALVTIRSLLTAEQWEQLHAGMRRWHGPQDGQPQS